MVRTDIRPIKLEDIYLKITDTDAYGLNESFEIASAFQRGSEGFGVWTFEAQQNYIISLKSRYPTVKRVVFKSFCSAVESISGIIL